MTGVSPLTCRSRALSHKTSNSLRHITLGPRGRGRAALIGGSAPQFGCWNATLLDTVQVVAIQPWSLWFRSNAPPATKLGLPP